MAGTTHHWAVALAMAVGLTTGLTPPAGATPPTCANLEAPRPLANPALKKIADVMPHKCDDQIWGRWLCGERYHDGGRGTAVGVGMTITLTSDVTPEGLERIRHQVEPEGFASRIDVFYPVDRQWHPDPMNKILNRSPNESLMKNVSCNKVSPFGKKIVAFYHKRADGSKEGRGWVDYYMTSAPNLMEMKIYNYQPQPGGEEGELIEHHVCERLSR